MPHIVVEHSRDDHDPSVIRSLMQALHDAAIRTGIMKAADVKVRAIPYDDYLVAGHRDSFCHVSVYLLEGRTAEQKVELAEALRAVLVAQLAETVSLSVDIRDMDAVAYKKRLLE